ncbi:MAG: cytochrome c3 family protein, partial [Verrucomicrobiota bacterium]|nr:cytochrome c3 family protein [Verrucomicrobiota bacterium]
MIRNALVLAIAMAGFWFCGCSKGDPTAGSSGSKAAAKPRPAYVGRDSCVECHAEAVAKWEGSHHFHAMELPNDKTVRADFNGTTFTHHNITSRFFKKDDHYMVETENQEGKPETFPVKYTFGWEPLQQYLVEFPDGRLQVLPFCWDVEGKRWFHVYNEERIPPHDQLFWTRPMQNWDHMCADCHSTNVRKKFDPDTERFATSFSEINVSCEACHGPAEKHVAMARAGDWKGDAFFGLADVKSDNRAQLESCAKCHARRSTVDLNHHAGDKFTDHYLLELLEPWAARVGSPAYHPDGQIDEEVYVTGSYVQSKMFHKGVKCVDCHDPHTARTLATGNALCMRCHIPKPENPTLYDS